VEKDRDVPEQIREPPLRGITSFEKEFVARFGDEESASVFWQLSANTPDADSENFGDAA
jgi:hypothetical protein